MIHQFDPAMAPDADFVPGALAHLVPGNSGRMLDRRRTPVRVVALRPETGTWTCEVLAFEDQGARWELPFETVNRYQFERGAASADEAALRRIRSAVRKFNRAAPVPLNTRNRKPTARKIEKLRLEVAAWLKSESRFIAARGTIDLGARQGSPLLAGDLEAFMQARGLGELEREFSASFVSNPASGETTKVHAMALADLGLASYYGTVVRDPTSLEPPWTMERRREHILARLAFVREAFSMLGIGPLVLYRAVGVLALDLADLAQVDLERPVGDELDVVEADHARAVHVQRAEAARGVDDRVAERLPHRPAPAEVEGAHHLLARVRGRGTREPERVRALDAGEIDGEVGHGHLGARRPRHRRGSGGSPAAGHAKRAV